MSGQSFLETTGFDIFLNLTYQQVAILLTCLTGFVLFNLAFYRLSTILGRDVEPIPKPAKHLLIVLGSGGHTAEMLNILQQAPLLQLEYVHRTYLVSSGDNFSASKAVEFEKELLEQLRREEIAGAHESYDVVTVRRARRVHQGVMTAPLTTLQCLVDCFRVLRGRHPDLHVKHRPDLILTNGPGTGVCVVLAAILLLFFGGDGQRTIFVESWARVKTLSLSGKILKPFVDRFIVQWPDLVETEGSRVEYIGPLVT